jgi:hypothetical protein
MELHCSAISTTDFLLTFRRWFTKTQQGVRNEGNFLLIERCVNGSAVVHCCFPVSRVERDRRGNARAGNGSTRPIS